MSRKIKTHTSMEVIVDGIIYQLQSQGGISRLYSEILPRMCEIDDSLNIKLMTSGRVEQLLPFHPHIKHYHIPQVERYLRPGRIWNPIIPAVRRLVHKLCIGNGEGQIWHSTYYTMPEHWNGLHVVTFHDMIYERFPNWFNGQSSDQFREQKKHCFHEADAVICVSETTRQDLQHFYGFESKSIYVIPHGYNNVFRQMEQSMGELEMQSGKPFLLYIGTRTHYKNFDIIIQAYSIWSRKKDIDLILVGRPLSTDEKCKLVELGIQDSLHLLTNVDDEELCRFYNKAVAFVYPSLYEGFGISLLEAMACGCPIIASRIPSTIEVAGECPIYFDHHAINDLVAAFDVALQEGRNSKRTKEGLKRVKSYSWNKTAAKTLEVYQGISKI